MTEEIRNEKGLPHGSEGGPVSSDHQEQGQASNNADGAGGQANLQDKPVNEGGSCGSGGTGGDWGGGAGARYQKYPCGEGVPKNAREVGRWFYFDADETPRFLKIKYHYTDDDGHLVLYKDGKPAKKYPTFHWTPVNHFARPFDGDMRNWTRGTKGLPPILYNLDLLKNAAPEADLEDRIVVTEGEKDAVTVLDVGLGIGTCSILGAVRKDGAGWDDDYTQQLVATGIKKLLLVEDNDRAGRRHVKEVGRKLKAAGFELEMISFAKFGAHSEDGFDLTDFTEMRLAEGKIYEEIKTELLGMVKAWRGELPKIKVSAGALSYAIDDTEAAIISEECPVFARGKILVQPIVTSYKTAKKDVLTEVVTLSELSPVSLAYMVNKRAASYWKYSAKTKDDVVMDPPPKVMAGLLQKGQFKIPQVVGVVSCPTLRPDGTILEEPGYDPETRLWLQPDPNLKMPDIPLIPTKQDAQEALQLFLDLIAGFSLVEQVDRSVVIASILSVVCRGAFTVGPAYLYKAHTAGEGKSYLVDLVSTIIRGRPCPVITMSGNKEEDEKRLGALLLEGVSIASLDNCVNNIGGELLCQIATQQLVKIRILGLSETPDCEWAGTLFATGNNVSYVGDMTRRGLVANLNSGQDQPELRSFAFYPTDRVLEDRGKYIAAALTIVRAYMVSGERVTCDQIATYSPSGWSFVVREPLIWLGMPDPWGCTAEARKNDPERSLAVALCDLIKKHVGVDKPFKSSDLIKLAKEGHMGDHMENGVPAEYVYEHPDLHDFLIEKFPGDTRGIAINAGKLGRRLGMIQGQVHDGYRIVEVGLRHGVMAFRLENAT